MAEDFRLGIGGPFYRLERSTHVDTSRRLISALVAITWVPLFGFALGRWVLHEPIEPLFHDRSLHARLLLALPLFVLAQDLLDRVGRSAMRRIFVEDYLSSESSRELKKVMARVEHWRDAMLPETILLACALSVGIGVLTNWVPAAGPIHAIATSGLGPIRVWYALVSLPIFQFMLWRTVFRWLLWLRVLAALARTPLRLLPMHADRRGGIGFLKVPSVYFCSLMLLATNSVICAGWATRMVEHGERLQTFRAPFFAIVLIGMLVAFAPHVVFTPQLYTARVRGIREYGGLVSHYVRAFHQRWIAAEDRSNLLGSPDMQSLADLGDSYRNNVAGLGVILFSAPDWETLLCAALLPAIPLLFMEQTTHEVIKRVLKMFVGAVP